MKVVRATALVLTVVGAVNWGLVGLLKFNLVQALFGDSVLAAAVYTLVGVAGIVLAAQAVTGASPVLSPRTAR